MREKEKEDAVYVDNKCRFTLLRASSRRRGLFGHIMANKLQLPQNEISAINQWEEIKSSPPAMPPSLLLKMLPKSHRWCPFQCIQTSEKTTITWPLLSKVVYLYASTLGLPHPKRKDVYVPSRTKSAEEPREPTEWELYCMRHRVQRGRRVAKSKPEVNTWKSAKCPP